MEVVLISRCTGAVCWGLRFFLVMVCVSTFYELRQMPKKVGELKQMLQKAGFILLPNKRGKGSHSYWIHPLLPKPVVLSGKDSKDAKTYQEKDIMASIKELEQLEQGYEQ